jgi:hypothetical protein
MNQSAIRIMLVLTVGGLIGLSCNKPGTPNTAPTITSLVLPDSADASADETLSVVASDPDGDPLAYDWTCSAGSLIPRTSATVIWAAPESSGTATIAVTVTDDSGSSATQSGTVVIKPVTTTIIDWDGSVAAGDVQLWSRNIPSGYTVSGSFSVDGQDITFLMLDAYNYERWRNDSSYTALVKVERSAGSSFSAVVDTSATLCNFILDNTYNVSADTAVHLFVQSTSP